MIKQIALLVWNRKRSNALIVIEIFLSFLVLFALSTIYLHFWNIYRYPLGYSYHDMWAIHIDTGGPWQPEMARTIQQLRRAALEFERVEAVEALSMPPFLNWTWSLTLHNGDQELRAFFNRASDGFAETVGLNLIEGRWFGPEDDGSAWEPVVINKRLSREIFGSDSALRKKIEERKEYDSKNPEMRVVGVIEDFRQHGEFKLLPFYVFKRSAWVDASENATRILHIKLRPGTTAGFEEPLTERLQSVGKSWSFLIKPWSEMRQEKLKSVLTPLIAIGILSGFLILMVALGLLGVLWQNVTQRTQELGLRRAMGATRARVQQQITGELMMVTTLGIVLGAIFGLQVPILGFFHTVALEVFIWGFIAATATMYAISLTCALYPAWLATKINPARALHSE